MQSVNLHKRLYLIYTEVGDGNLDKRFSTPEIYKNNRKNFYKLLKSNPYQLIEGAQIHSDRILKLDPENSKMWRGHNITGVDGFISAENDNFLMLRVADCVPLVLYDPVHHAIGVIHAGLQGTVADIHRKALMRLSADFGSLAKEILVWFGPCAHSECYFTQEEPPQREDPAWKPYIHKKKDRYYIDFLNYQIDTLKSAGVLKKNMLVDPHCTVETPSLFSHLRSKTTLEPEGRFAVVAKLLA